MSINSTDAVEWLRSLPDACADLIVTDPPYESLERHRAVGTTTRLKHSKASSNDWFHVFPNCRFRDLLSELYRVLRRNRHCYIFCDQETMFVLKPVAEEVGFRFWKPIVWDKVTIGMGYHYRARYEFVLFFEKGKRRLNDLSISDVLEFKRVRNGYPAQKPLELIQALIMQSSQINELVLDPFFGSGTTIVASRRLGRAAWGTDTSRQAHQTTVERLAAEGYHKGTSPSPI
ncbi:MAG: site-specific DNA-methyltransferase [Thiotrichales bacterium]|nr:site-specific DNA-methyltransferase [Thiotrichales bacterium]